MKTVSCGIHYALMMRQTFCWWIMSMASLKSTWLAYTCVRVLSGLVSISLFFSGFFCFQWLAWHLSGSNLPLLLPSSSEAGFGGPHSHCFHLFPHSLRLCLVYSVKGLFAMVSHIFFSLSCYCGFPGPFLLSLTHGVVVMRF